jgi:drug/metabolite transporter (DMT)-like permease
LHGYDPISSIVLLDKRDIVSIWVIITLLAVAFQSSRTAAQHRLRSVLSVSTAGFVRYAYGAPLAFLALFLVVKTTGVPIPVLSELPLRFWLTVAGAGVAQIFATVCLIRSFDSRNYSAGTVYAKTQTVQAAIFQSVLFGETIRISGWISIGICLAGIILLISKSEVKGLQRFKDPAALYGIAAGGFLAVYFLGIRSASKGLGSGHPELLRAVFILAVMNTIQTVLNGCYLYINDPSDLKKAVQTWRSSSVVGLLSISGSACWAIAMTLRNVAQVLTVGQMELVFTFVIARFWLGERHTKREIAASGLVIAGVLGVVLAGG